MEYYGQINKIESENSKKNKLRKFSNKKIQTNNRTERIGYLKI